MGCGTTGHRTGSPYAEEEEEEVGVAEVWQLGPCPDAFII